MACKSRVLWIILFLCTSVGRIASGQETNNKICEHKTCDVKDHFSEKFRAIEDAQDYFLGVKKEVRELNSSVSAELKFRETLEKQLLDLEKNITRETNVRKEVEGNLTTLQGDVRNLHSSLVLLSNNSELDDFDKNLKSIKNKQSSLNNDLGKINLQLSEINQTLSRSVSELNSSLHQLQSSSYVTTTPTIHPDVNHLKKLIEDVEKSLKNNFKNLTDASIALNQRINDTIKTMRDQEQDFNQRISKLQQTQTEEIEDLKKQIQSFTESQENLINQIEYLNSTLQQHISQTSTPKSQGLSCMLELPTDKIIILKLNGHAATASSLVKDGEAAKYECSNKNYTLEGFAERICTDGEWSGPQPHCTEILFGTDSNRCPKPKGTFRDVNNCGVFYTCDEMYDTQRFVCDVGTYFNTNSLHCESGKPDDCP